jgi:hypothetical protein
VFREPTLLARIHPHRCARAPGSGHALLLPLRQALCSRPVLLRASHLGYASHVTRRRTVEESMVLFGEDCLKNGTRYRWGPGPGGGGAAKDVHSDTSVGGGPRQPLSEWLCA